MILALLLLVSSAYGDDFGLRVGTGAFKDSTIFNMGLGMSGKTAQAMYRTDGLLYLEASLGVACDMDFGQPSGIIAEVSPGVRVQAGQFEVRLSQGVSQLKGLQFVTHFSINIVDQSGVAIGLERSHYSNGDARPDQGYDYTGLTLTIRR